MKKELLPTISVGATTMSVVPVEEKNASQSYSPEVLIAQAIDKGLPVETMERLLAMRTALKAEAAKEAFDEAMANFQAECPIVGKGKEVKNRSGVVMYHYAPLDSIVTEVKGIIGKHGFSYSIKTEIKENAVKVVCIVKHKGGHSELSDMEVPLATRTEIMSAPQQTAATMTFAKRYAFCNAFGIMTGDEDTDATPQTTHAEVGSKATEAQMNTISELAMQAGYSKADVGVRCRELYGVSILDITTVQADGIITGLMKRITQKTAV
ncbi:MAG: ERF family protein [Candidatus Paceibacterota bacterium]|jgi:hypothetical protein